MWSLSFRFSHQIFVCISLIAYTYHMKATNTLELGYNVMKATENVVSL
jgi:hypothetical protein